MAPKYLTGDVIFRSDPWVYSVASDKVGHCCYHCLVTPLSLIRCNDCKFARYCTRKCQEDDTTRHKEECYILGHLLEKGFVTIPTDILLLIKVLIKLEKGQLADIPLCPITHRTFDSLLSHEEEINLDTSRLTELNELHAVFGKFVTTPEEGRNKAVDMQLFIRILGKLQCNAFGILDSMLRKTAEAVYLGPSILDHSCQRNAVYFFDGPTVCVKAIKPIDCLEDVRTLVQFPVNCKQN